MRTWLLVLLFLAMPFIAGAAERQPAVAGTFYPDSPEKINDLIKQFIESSKSTATLASGSDLTALIVPHAGWIYSGQTAVSGFKAISELKFDYCIFLGVDHRSSLSENGLWADTGFKTPLGTVAVDRSLTGYFEAEGLRHSPSQHVNEHSIEVLLPFFQHFFPRSSAAFISCGGGIEQANALAAILKKIVGRLSGHVLLVVSTDWSHYHHAERAKELDSKGIESVIRLDAAALLEKCRKGESELCGFNGVYAATKLLAGASGTAQLLAQTDSSFASGDRDRVVGYAAILLQGTKKNLEKNTTRENTMGFQKEALDAVRKTLESHLSGQKSGPLKFSDPRFKEKSGVFVTLKKHGELRGCIGFIIGYEPLETAIPQMAISAATHDPRFNPVTADELKDIRIEISVLTPMQDVKDISEIKIGRDGLLLQMGGRSGLLLPQVPVEWNWDVEEFLENLCHKAGLPAGSHLNPQAHLQRFSADVFGEE
ncbi:MAG: AmmeMemoRadiSam system protein B [Candidatus Riflebacteria bacterium]